MRLSAQLGQTLLEKNEGLAQHAAESEARLATWRAEQDVQDARWEHERKQHESQRKKWNLERDAMEQDLEQFKFQLGILTFLTKRRLIACLRNVLVSAPPYFSWQHRLNAIAAIGAVTL